MRRAAVLVAWLAALGTGCGTRSLGHDDGSSVTAEAGDDSTDPSTSDATTVGAGDTTRDDSDVGSLGCDYDCQGGDCVGGRCGPVFVMKGLVTGRNGVTADATSAYWVQSGLGSVKDIRRVSLAGGDPEILVVDPLRGSIVSDATHLYYPSWWDGTSALYALPKAGGMSEVVVDDLWGGVYGLAQTGEWLYWVVDGTPLFPEGDAEVGRVSLTDGTVERVAFVENLIGALAVSETEAYWGNYHDIHRWEPAANVVEDVIAEDDRIRSIALQASLICWITPQAVSCADLDAGQRWTIAPIVESDNYELKLVLDEAHLFWPDASPHGLRMASPHGGEVEILVETAALPHSLIATEDMLLWVEGDELWRIAKPPSGS